MTLKKLFGIGILASAAFLGACSDSESSDNQSLAEQVNYKVVGIEPGAGLTSLAETTLESYDNLKDWDLEISSTAGMLGSLDKAISNKEPIVITGWTPHWMFEAYDLKILEDPKGTLGAEENIETLARKDLKNDLPHAYEVLDRFNWEAEDMEQVMFDGQSMDYAEAAQKWIDENPDKVAQWTEGIPQSNGEEVNLITTQWDSELASTTVVQLVLQSLGYKVIMTPVDPAIMFEAIANGEGDATVAPWLPTTHAAFYEKHKDSIDDLGPNLTGTQNGFVVPSYVEIDSIEDL
jgi:glycine betaine/proline transport system substrate-binding protein